MFYPSVIMLSWSAVCVLSKRLVTVILITRIVWFRSTHFARWCFSLSTTYYIGVTCSSLEGYLWEKPFFEIDAGFK